MGMFPSYAATAIRRENHLLYLFMMRPLILLTLLWVTFSCANKDSGNNTIKLSSTHMVPDLSPVRGQRTDASFDSTFYIGYVDFFPETREFYTALFYREGFENPDEEMLESKLDSVIFSGDDWGRERLPMVEAKKMLVLSGLDSIYIFNRHHQRIARASLSRVEYLWDGLESYFVGVFKSDVALNEQTEELYGISAGYPVLNESSFSCEEVQDQKLNAKLIAQLHIDPSMNWDMRHFMTQPREVTYSIISSYKIESQEGKSFLTSLENNKVNILNEAVNDYHFLNILPLPIEVNSRPLLLISAGYPSSDVLWDYLAAFDGKTYEAIDYNRINPKKMLSSVVSQ
jgi:hypothetical protein